MSYQRVIPRDLFNEAKLLKCLGQLSLLVENGVLQSLRVELDEVYDGFDVEQDENDGSIYCPGIDVVFGDGVEIYVYSPLNSRSSYPLQFSCRGESGDVFDDDGSTSTMFTNLLERLATDA